nr:hypothetical protein [Tanacetum cinerariifolium]
MALTFADTHNMIAYLTKSDASEGFNQIIDFLNASSIKYALTVNPNIYVSCIKQLWTSVSVKKVNDVTRLQALVDKKKVIITEATIRDALRLNDAKGIDCLPNEEIFTELSRIGYEKPSTKLTFYKAFFSSQWKFRIHIILQCMSAKRTSWNEFSSSIASAVICLSTGKGFSIVETPLFEGMIVAQQVCKSAAKVNVEDVPAGGVADEGVASVADDVVLTVVEEPFIPSPTSPTPPPQPSQDIPSNSQGRIIADMNADEDVTLKDVADVTEDVQDAEIKESSDVQGRQAESQAQIYQIDLKYADKVLITAASATITVAAPLQLITAADPTLTTAPSATRRRKGVVIRDIKETDTPSTIIHFKAKSKDKWERDFGTKYDDIRSIFEKYFNSNVAFLQKTKEQIEEEDSGALKRISKSQEDKVATKQKLDEEVAELKRHLQIVPNDDDDVFTEATPLARKVLVVDYKIYTENNKPYYRIIRADRSPQLFLIFLSLLRNFDR